MIRASITALLLSAAPALAEGVPYAPCDYPGQYAHCPSTPQPNDPLSVALQQAMAQGQAQGQSQNAVGIGQGGNAKATGGRGGNAVSRNDNRDSNRNANQNSNSASTGPITIDNRVRQAASSAAPVTLPSSYATNCFGDINPSGSFGASFQGFLGGAAATAQKAGNVCAVYAIAGPEVALRYLQRMDPNVPNPVTLERQSAPYCADPAYPNLRNGRCYQ